MSEALREQRPLLCEDQSEEENFPDFPRRYRPFYFGRARNTAKGATAIITRWPDHLSSTFTVWWIGLCMLILMIFAIYNVVVAFALFPTAHMKPKILRPSNEIDFTGTSSLPEIFIHFIVNNNEETDLNKYLPYIEIISDKHLDYNFNVILLTNDTSTTYKAIVQSAEQNNENALNSLFSEEKNDIEKTKSRKNIRIVREALSQFMKESPLRTDWRRVPSYLIDFVVKAISIWEKGGIAINPEILTPHSPNVMYIERFQHLLNKYKTFSANTPNEQKSKKYFLKQKVNFGKKVNNIRDIINILEQEHVNNDSQETLTEAENLNIPVNVHSGRKLLSTNSEIQNDRSKAVSPIITELHQIPLSTSLDIEDVERKTKYTPNIHYHEEIDPLVIVNEGFDMISDNKETKFGFFPLFLDFLFHDEKPSVLKEKKIDKIEKHRKSIQQKEIRTKKNASASLLILNNSSALNDTEKHKPVTVTVKKVVKINKDNNVDLLPEKAKELTIDLKGNILATKASCHAFIGTLFSNIIHNPPQNSLQHFISSELSCFCRGFLSSCRGIDVILL